MDLERHFKFENLIFRDVLCNKNDLRSESHGYEHYRSDICYFLSVMGGGYYIKKKN